jgi:hypothetical protein
MSRLTAMLTIVLCTCATPVLAQNWSIVLAAVGADTVTTALSGGLLKAVRDQLEPHGLISVRDTMQDLRVDLPVTAVFSRAVNLGANGVAVLQFHAAGGPATGYAHLWVSRIGGAPEYRIAYVPDALSDLSEIGRTFAAAIISTISGGAYHLVELHVFSWPAAVSVRVGDGHVVTTDRPGRRPGEGFNVWAGVRPAGITSITLSKAGYEERIVRVELPLPGKDAYRIPVETELTRSAGAD